ncbi:hypothetical protein GOP47_0027313 [Adiantum capillus-veneris]|nr:hypothetical protein GOP47_0027313 [Adiantum capillus-veneris]
MGVTLSIGGVTGVIVGLETKQEQLINDVETTKTVVHKLKYQMATQGNSGYEKCEGNRGHENFEG